MTQADLHSLELAALRPAADVHPGVQQVLGETPAPGTFPMRSAEASERLQDFVSVGLGALEAGDTELSPRENALLQHRRDMLMQVGGLVATADSVMGSSRVDPDLLGDNVALLLSQVVAEATPEEREQRTAQHLGALAQRLTEAEFPGPADPLLVERALTFADAMPDLVSALPHLLGLEESPAELTEASTSLLSALETYKQRLGSLEKAPNPVALGPDGFGELLEAALMSSDLNAAQLAIRREVEEMSCEMQRIAHRGFRRAPLDDALTTSREQLPFTSEEAVAWLDELAEQSRDFVDETEWFQNSLNHPLVVHEGALGLRVLLGPVTYVGPTRTARSRGHLFLSASNDENELKGFSVADLEVLVSRFGYPGVHLAACAAQAAPLNTATHVALEHTHGALFGAEVELGWPLFAIELMRELQFRDSPAVRLITAQSLLRASVCAWYDLQLALGEIDVDGATAGLARNAGLDPASARITALNAYRRPGRLMAGVLGKNALKRLRRTAHGRWRHGYSDRRFYEVVLSNGAIPVTALADLLEAYSPFNSEEGTLEFELPPEGGAVP